MRTYATLLSTDDYLDGAVVLNESLAATAPEYPFVVLVTDNVSAAARAELAARRIAVERIEPWPKATRWASSSEVDPAVQREWRWRFNHAKLRLFGLVQYSKIVFLDSDAIVLRNIDELFETPHMSAVNAGGHLPELADWRQLNSGVLVIEPSLELQAAMLERFPLVEFSRGGDQEFLHAFFSSWPEQSERHLDHRFNLFHTHLDRYHQLFGYSLDDDELGVKVLHFYAAPKPWEQLNAIRALARVPQRTKKTGIKGAFLLAATLRPRHPREELGPLAQAGLVRWLEVYEATTGATAEAGEAGPRSRGGRRIRGA